MRLAIRWCVFVCVELLCILVTVRRLSDSAIKTLTCYSSISHRCVSYCLILFFYLQRVSPRRKFSSRSSSERKKARVGWRYGLLGWHDLLPASCSNSMLPHNLLPHQNQIYRRCNMRVNNFVSSFLLSFYCAKFFTWKWDGMG